MLYKLIRRSSENRNPYLNLFCHRLREKQNTNDLEKRKKHYLL